MNGRIALVIALVVGQANFAVRAQSGLSLQLAEGVQAKIEAMKKKQAAANPKTRLERADLSEIELESYVLFAMRQKIPAKIDSFDVQFGPGTAATDAQLTLGPNTTGNYVVDKIVQGTHRLFVKGRLTGAMGRARFELESVNVDRLPVPVFLAELVFNRLVKPVIPTADIKEPFDLPFGIDILNILPGRAIVYY